MVDLANYGVSGEYGGSAEPGGYGLPGESDDSGDTGEMVRFSQFGGTRNGTSGAKIKILRPPTPPN